MAGRGGGRIPHAEDIDIGLGMAANRPLPEGMGLQLGDIKCMYTCPYHESHVVGAGKYASHVNACRMAAPENIKNRFIVCVFNATHHVKRELMSAHMRICPDRAAASVGVVDLSPEFYDVFIAPDKIEKVEEKVEDAAVDDEVLTKSEERQVDDEPKAAVDDEVLTKSEERQVDDEPKAAVDDEVLTKSEERQVDDYEKAEDTAEPSCLSEDKRKESLLRWGPLRKHSTVLLQMGGVPANQSPWVNYTWYTGRGRGSTKLWQGFGDEPESSEPGQG